MAGWKRELQVRARNGDHDHETDSYIHLQTLMIAMMMSQRELENLEAETAKLNLTRRQLEHAREQVKQEEMLLRMRKRIHLKSVDRKRNFI